MLWLFAGWLATASAADVQELVEHEWSRATPATLVAATPPDDPTARALLARSLGRLRTADALPALKRLQDDPDLAVRRAVAISLGWTPGATPAIRAWLDASPPGPPFDPTAADRRIRPALLASLGTAGDASDVPRLIAALAEPGRSGTAAAVALGRLGRGGVTETRRAVPALVAALPAHTIRRAEAVAFALFRIGLDDADPAQVCTALAAWPTLVAGPARAWTLRALWPRLDRRERAAALGTALQDPALEVRIAVLDALGKGDAPAALLADRLADPDPGIRRAALNALGRVGGAPAVAALTRRLDDPDPWVVGAALRALGKAGSAPDPDPWLATTRPVPVRAAAASLLTDPARLEDLALHDEAPPVRTAAVEALLDRKAPPDPARVERLRGASDEAVRDATAELGERLGQPAPPPPAFHSPPGVPTELAQIRRIRVARVITDRGEFRITLFPEVAPLAVSTFAALADKDFFDGLTFHRVVPAFVVQGGDPRGDGWGGPGFTIPDEDSALPYDTGAVGIARDGRDTGGCQWFVTLTPQPHLVGDYTELGRVDFGMPVVRMLRQGDRIRDVIIERVP